MSSLGDWQNKLFLFCSAARSGFLDGNLYDEEYDISWKNQPCQIDGDFSALFELGDCEIPNIAFTGPYLKKRCNFRK